MIEVRINRIGEYRGATHGILLVNDKPQLCTLELPWLDNQASISCIPTGNYTCKRHISPRFGETFQILNVPNRDDILIHWGNTVKDTKGCILLGSWFGTLLDLPAVINSRISFQKFMNLTAGKETFNLTIR